MKIKVLLCLLLVSILTNAQVSVSESFETGFPAGWSVESQSQNFSRVNNATFACDGTWVMGTSLHSGNKHAMIITSAYTSEGKGIIVSFQFNRGVGSIAGNAILYYEINNSGTWEKIASTGINVNCNTVSAIINRGVVPAGALVKFRMQLKWNGGAGVTPVYIDNFKAIQQSVLSVYDFNNSYNDTLGTNPFSSANTSFVADRFGNANSALKITGGAFSTANIPLIPIGNFPRTISIWYKTSANNNTAVFSYGAAAPYQTFGLYLGTNGNPIFQAHTNDKDFGGNYAANMWQHAVITFNGSTVKMYMNGDSIGSQAYTLNTGTSNFKLGGVTEIVVDDLKIYDSALTAAEVTAIDTLPYIPTPITTYYFNNTRSDAYGVNPFSAANTSFVVDRFGNANSAMEIANQSSTANIPLIPRGNFSRTISIWYKTNANNNTPIFSYGAAAANQTFGLYLGTNGNPIFQAHTNDKDFGGNYAASMWQHAVITFDGSVVKMYMNGILKGTQSYSLNTGGNGDFKLGGIGFSVIVDNLDIYSVALSDVDVANLYVYGNLPVVLSSFTAQLKNRITNLLWSSATEINTSHFDIEYSNNGSEFAKVGSVQAQGNSSTAKQYSYQHIINEQPVHFYRLKMVDKDGKFAYSNIVRLKNAVKSFEASVYPTVVTNAATLSITSKEKGNAVITVTSMDGKRMLQKNIVLIEGSQTMPLHLENLTKGSYIVSIRVNSDIESYTIIKQ